MHTPVHKQLIKKWTKKSNRPDKHHRKKLIHIGVYVQVHKHTHTHRYALYPEAQVTICLSCPWIFLIQWNGTRQPRKHLENFSKTRYANIKYNSVRIDSPWRTDHIVCCLAFFHIEDIIVWCLGNLYQILLGMPLKIRILFNVYIECLAKDIEV